jgi:arsenate reductase
MSTLHLAGLGVLALVVGADPTGTHPEAVNEKLREYIAARSTEFDKIPQPRRHELQEIAAYVREKTRQGRPARLTFVCTHNSRRSILCQVWGAAAAAYFGIPEVETFSGGTQATAFNSRAVAVLRRAGFEIDKAAPGKNPHYAVRYRAGGPALDCFSKVYGDAWNPKADFCVVMTCAEADKQCPFVPGAALRIGLPFDDPKAFDNTPREAAMYDERCQQIARELLYVFSEAVQPQDKRVQRSAS